MGGGELNEQDLRRLIEAGISGRRWADLGCGEGNFTLVLSDLLGDAGEVWAIDRDEGALEELRRRIDGRAIHIERADFRRPLAVLPQDLDGILMANSLHFVKDKSLVLESLLSHLRLHGRFLLVEYGADHGNPWVPHPISLATWRRLAASVGLSEPRQLGTYPSRWLGGMYSAVSERTR